MNCTNLRTKGLLAGLFAALFVVACSKGSDGTLTSGDPSTAKTYAECPDGQPCTNLNMEDVIAEAVARYKLDKVVTIGMLDGQLVLQPPANCKQICVGYLDNTCIDSENKIKTEAKCTTLGTQCEQNCRRTFSLEGHAKEDFSMALPDNYVAIQLNVRACVDAGNDALFFDNATLYYKTLPGGSVGVVTEGTDNLSGETANLNVRFSAPVGRSSHCADEVKFKAHVTVANASGEIFFTDHASGQGTATERKKYNYKTIDLTGLAEGGNYVWNRPDLAPFGLRMLQDKVDFSDGVRWVLKNVKETGGIHHIIHFFDNQIIGTRPIFAIESWAPYDPTVEYEVYGFIKPKA